MCLAIKTNGNEIPKSYLRRGFKRNPHGAGFSIIKDGKIFVSKGYFSFEEFYKAYHPFKNEPALIHFRYMTTGRQGKLNCHPFKFGRGKYSVIHNGVIHRVEPEGERSDTAQFTYEFLNEWIKKYSFDSKIFKRRISQFVGRANKLVLMDEMGKSIIINEDLGVWKNGVWYSNYDYRFLGEFKRTWRKNKGKLKRFLHNLVNKI